MPARGGRGLSGPLSRRRFLQVLAGLAVGTALRPLWAAGAARTAVEAHRVSLGLPLRVVELSDIHIGPHLSPAQLAPYVDQVIAARPDVVLLPGDFIATSMDDFSACARELGRVRPPYGTYAALGNHDHWYGSLAEMARGFAEHGITLLQNAHTVVSTDGGPLVIAGLDDPTGGANLPATLAGRPAKVPTILLSHRPEILPWAAAAGVDLVLAGHWHGGQITVRLPGTALSIATLNTPYPEGLYRHGPAALYVTRGIGTSILPFRWNAPPEVTVLDLA